MMKQMLAGTMTARSWSLTLIDKPCTELPSGSRALRLQRLLEPQNACYCLIGEGAPLPPATPEDSSSEQEPSASRFLLSKKLYACQQRSDAAASGKASQYSAQSSPVSAYCLRDLLQVHPHRLEPYTAVYLDTCKHRARSSLASSNLSLT